MLDLTLPNLFQNVFTPKECQSILKYVEDSDQNRSIQQQLSTFFPYEKKHSSYQAYFIPTDEKSQWIFHKIISLFYQVNQVHYQFEYHDIFATHIRLFQSGDYFDWHHDLGQEQFSKRKLGFILNLSPPNNYRGGEIAFNNASKSKMAPQQGSICIYPAYSLYKIEPITSGNKAILCSWTHGKECFK